MEAPGPWQKAEEIASTSVMECTVEPIGQTGFKIPSGKLTWLLKMTIYSGFSH
jgi:hypothetical protein